LIVRTLPDGRRRHNGEGSIHPYRNGFAAYCWVTRPNSRRARKYVYGKTRAEVHAKWLDLQRQAANGPVATSTPTFASFAAYWLEEIVKPNLAPSSYARFSVTMEINTAVSSKQTRDALKRLGASLG
jgi:hypothetical protein